ncbi:MAG: acyl-CoA thioesterase [Hyphomicrobiaceae bacterium]
MPEQPPFRHYVRVRYQDCDSQHVVFNARYGDYLDLAITEFMAAVMPERDPFDNTFEIQLKKQVTEWMAPARFQDVLEISTFVTRIGKTSFEVHFDLRLAGKGPDVIVAADGVYVHVVDQAGRWKSNPIPDGARAQLLAGAKGVIVDHAGFHPIVRPQV